MKKKTVLIVLGVGAVGAAAWWYMKNKNTPPPTMAEKIMANNPGVYIAPLPDKFPLKESTIKTLPHAISDLKMNSGNTGIVPPLLTTSTVKPAAIPAIAPPPVTPKPTASVSNAPAGFQNLSAKSQDILRKTLFLKGLGNFNMN